MPATVRRNNQQSGAYRPAQQSREGILETEAIQVEGPGFPE
jgi:hypothetical protein